VYSNEVSKQGEMNFQILKEVFVTNIIIYNNLSHFSNIYYGLGETKVLHDPIFQNCGRKKLKDS